MDERNENFKEKTKFLFDVIKRYDHYVATTNFKVGLMMSFVAAIVFGLTLRVMSITPPSSGCNYIYYSAVISSALTVLLSLLAALNLFRAVFPNTKTNDSKKSLIFFGDVACCNNGIDGYMEKLKESTKKSLFEDLSKQTFIVAKIINEKFRVLKIAARIIIFGVIPLLAISLLLLILEGAK